MPCILVRGLVCPLGFCYWAASVTCWSSHSGQALRCLLLVLFEHDTFLDSLDSRGHELTLALKSFCLLFALGISPDENEQEMKYIFDISYRLVMEKTAQGNVQLSTLQTLCLLSMVDFTGL